MNRQESKSEQPRGEPVSGYGGKVWWRGGAGGGLLCFSGLFIKEFPIVPRVPKAGRYGLVISVSERIVREGRWRALVVRSSGGVGATYHNYKIKKG